MSTMPPDWDKDQKLWKLLDTPSPKTSTNFNYLVRRRIDELAKAKKHSPYSTFFEGIGIFFRSWTGPVAIATACVMIGIVLWHGPKETGKEVQKGITTALLIPQKGEPVELAHIAQNFDLIQDMDVIEHLDELASNN
jgi:hypothetical protein